ncbi:MAG: ATP-dependent Lon protease, partial [Solirubrobacterales bacterium]|nr:ATP-dependent Lon protease [Solirubrobacterales bacterium]
MESSPGLEIVEAPIGEEIPAGDLPLPEALPVLPLRDSVAFPDTITPLAVGQARSIKLVDDVLGSNRMLVM